MRATAPQKNPSSGAEISRTMSQPAFVCLVLLLITFAVFWEVRKHDFVNFDDDEYFFANPQVQHGLTPDGLVWAFTTNQTGNWHPLTWLSLMLDADLFQGMFENNATGPHLMNVLLHAVNTILLFLFLRANTLAHWRSAFVAALFALHPLHVESVAWISERKDILSTLFWLLACLAYGRYAGALESRRPEARVFYWGTLICFALGLMSKPMLVTLPFVLLLLDYWPLNRFPGHRFDVSTLRRLVMEKVPFFILSAISCVITFSVQRHSGAVRSLEVLSMSARVVNAFVSYARYLGKTFWPADLVVLYPYPGHWATALVILAATLVVGLSAAAFWLRRRYPFFVTGWIWFLGTLIPVIGLVQVGRQSMADRYTYIPLIGIFIVLTWGAGIWAARWRLPTGVVTVATMLVLGACVIRTASQISCWQNSGTLFRHAIALTQNNSVAHDNLGMYLFVGGNQGEAIVEFHRALQINPNDPDALNCLGAVMAKQQRYAEANQYLQRLVQIHPWDPAVRFNYGAVLASQGNWAEAAAQFSEALRLNPNLVTARQLLEYANGHLQK
jgi:hypothetical protein